MVSSNIASIGYDRDRAVLEVEFRDGSLYHYFRVPAAEYAALMSASSHGTYLARHIKGVYTYAPV